MFFLPSSGPPAVPRPSRGAWFDERAQGLCGSNDIISAIETAISNLKENV